MRPLAPECAARLRGMLAAGLPYRAICVEIGCTKSTVSRYAALMGLGKSRRKHDWPSIRAFYESGDSGRATRLKFRIFAKTWQEAIKRGDIVPRPPRSWVRPLGAVITAQAVQRGHLRRRLVTEGLLVYECAICHITDWRSQALSLELDHINGDKHDNRLENLRILCPNCHSQTETYSGRNLKRSM